MENKYLNEQEFINKNFFIISSDNLTKINSKLYGYVFFDNKLFINIENFKQKIPESAIGIYLHINRGIHSVVAL